MMLLGAWTLAAYGQDTSGQNSNNAAPATPASDAANSGKSVAKATELPPSSTPASRVSSVSLDTYVIGVGDILDINVWKEPELSHGVPVRPDGMITMPLIGEIKASGLTPVQLQNQLTTALQKVMSEPQVTVMVSSVNSMSFNIMGQVNKPGYYPLLRPLTILDAIALSGGFRDFAKEKKVYLMRAAPDGTQQKYKFNYKEVIKGKNMAQNITIQARDTLVIP
jgi:polysaccharide export outer membrane protein